MNGCARVVSRFFGLSRTLGRGVIKESGAS